MRITSIITSLLILPLAHLQAATLSFSLTPTLSSGSDTNGIAGSAWVFDFEISQATYQPSGSFNDISFIADSAQLTITGAGNAALNGTHAITTTGGDGTFRFLPKLGLSTFLALEGPQNTISSFSFAGTSVTNFGPTANPNILNPSVGDPVDLAPYNLALFTGIFANAAGSYSYTTSPIPEPSSLAALASGLLFTAFRRRKG